MSPNIDTYERITARIIAELDKGTVPWRKPWKSGGAPVNVRTGRAYRGINWLMLTLEGRADARWGTFKAWKESGGSVRKGERGTRIILWKRSPRKQTAEERARGDEPTFYAFMREYVVFNAEQVDNAPELEQEEREPFVALERAEAIIEGMPNRPELRTGAEAFYRPSDDSVTLPPKEAFKSAEAYYSTAFHELTHATGAENRLGGLDPATFGSDPYAKEELVAELGSSFLAGTAELDCELEQSAAYIEGWRKQLSRDPKLIVSAAGEAQRRADYVLGVSWNDSKESADEQRAEGGSATSALEREPITV